MGEPASDGVAHVCRQSIEEVGSDVRLVDHFAECPFGKQEATNQCAGRDGRASRCPAKQVEQGDLPEVASGTEAPDLLATAGYVGLSLKDDEEVIAKPALLAQRTPRRIVPFPPPTGDATQLPR